MKKFTLLLSALAISVCADAQTTFDGWSKEKKALCSKHSIKLEKPFNVTSINNPTVMSQPLNKVKDASKIVSKVISREEEQLTAEAALFNGGILGSYNPFSMTATMVNAVVAYGTNEVYVLPYGDLSKYFTFIAGKIEDKPNSFSDSGVDSLTFVNGQVVGGLNSGVELCLYDCDVTGSGKTGYTAVPSQASTFGGYYIRSTGEVVIPSMIGIFAKGTTDLYSDVYMDLDIFPETYYLPSIYFATASATDYFNDEVVTPNTDYPVLAYIGDEVYYVRGGNMSAGVGNEWLSITPASDGSSNYAVTKEQYINTFKFTNKDGSTFGADCVTLPIGSDLYSKDEMLVGMSMDSQFNITLSALNGDMLGGYLYGENFLNEEGKTGYYSALSNWKILISSDLLIDGIKGVTTESGKVASKEYFDLSGRKVENAAKGLVIEKVTYTDGKTVSRKVVK